MEKCACLWPSGTVVPRFYFLFFPRVTVRQVRFLQSYGYQRGSNTRAVGEGTNPSLIGDVEEGRARVGMGGQSSSPTEAR